MSKRQNLPIPELSEADKERFASMVNTEPGQGPNGDCHTWKGAITHDGYGTISLGDRSFYAHRVALALALGRDPGQSLATHQCDFPRCVRGEHLKPGTYKSNAREMVERGRWRTGPRKNSRVNPNAPEAHHNGRAATVNKQRTNERKLNV